MLTKSGVLPMGSGHPPGIPQSIPRQPPPGRRADGRLAAAGRKGRFRPAGRLTRKVRSMRLKAYPLGIPMGTFTRLPCSVHLGLTFGIANAESGGSKSHSEHSAHQLPQLHCQ
jgi:hypothetical protein